MKTYCASFKEAWPFYLSVAFLAGLLIAVPLALNQGVGWPVLLGTALLALLAWTRFRLSVRVSDDGLSASGLFRDGHIEWAQITRVVATASAGYWRSGWAGPFTYDFVAGERRLSVNFKFFARDCFQEVMQRVPESVRRREGHDV